MRLEDKVPLNGYLTIYKLFPDGRRDYVIKDEPNKITYNSRIAHLKYLYDYDNAPRDQLAIFRIGTGGAVGGSCSGDQNARVITPDPSRNNLFSPVNLVNEAIDSITPSSVYGAPEDIGVYLQILFTVNQDEANGLKINECGLFKESGNMFNHKTFNSIEKNEAFSLVFDWKLRYV